jgi:hypothetical protein
MFPTIHLECDTIDAVFAFGPLQALAALASKRIKAFAMRHLSEPTIIGRGSLTLLQTVCSRLPAPCHAELAGRSELARASYDHERPSLQHG